MATTFSTASMRKVFSFPFADPHWKRKFLIGIGLIFSGFIIPILPGLFLQGYYYRILHHVIVKREEPTLPEWENWGELLRDGFRLFSVTFIYSLPLFVLSLIIMVLYIIFIISIPILVKTNPDSGLPILLMFTFIFLFILVVVVMMILETILSLIMPLAMCQTVAKGSFKGGFEISTWWKVFKTNFGGFFLAMLMSYGVLGIFMMVYYTLYMTMVLLCFIPFLLIIGGMFFGLTLFTLWASVYREGMMVAGELAG
jgi:hypothetical protein